MSPVARSVAAHEQAVVSIGSFRAGQANNVIPGTARLLGTIRTFDPEVRERVHQRVSDIVSNVGRGMGVAPELVIQPEYPVLNNDPGCAEAVRRVATKLVGAERVSAAGLPLTAAEDFAFFAEAVPSAYFFLGAGKPGEEVPVNKKFIFSPPFK